MKFLRVYGENFERFKRKSFDKILPKDEIFTRGSTFFRCRLRNLLFTETPVRDSLYGGLELLNLSARAFSRDACSLGTFKGLLVRNDGEMYSMCLHYSTPP